MPSTKVEDDYHDSFLHFIIKIIEVIVSNLSVIRLPKTIVGIYRSCNINRLSLTGRDPWHLKLTL